MDLTFLKFFYHFLKVHDIMSDSEPGRTEPVWSTGRASRRKVLQKIKERVESDESR
jgi:hypothetical protein